MRIAKKIFYVLGVAFLIVSCGKTRNCECTSKNKINGESKVTSQPIGSIGTLNSSKKKQKEECESQNLSNSYQENTCKLKD